MRISLKFTILLSVVILIILSGCSNNFTGEVAKENNVDSVEKIEVYHFHSDRQCNVCKTIGDNLDETITRHFSKEVNDGKIVYGHINVQDPKNAEITKRYGATGTSLWIGVYDKNGFRAENNRGVWYRLNDKEEFINYLKTLIDARLTKDMN